MLQLWGHFILSENSFPEHCLRLFPESLLSGRRRILAVSGKNGKIPSDPEVAVAQSILLLQFTPLAGATSDNAGASSGLNQEFCRIGLVMTGRTSSSSPAKGQNVYSITS